MKCKRFHKIIVCFCLVAGPALSAQTQTMGDVNGDGVVNCVDFNLVYASFGQSKGQSGYNSAADLNGDGVVNTEDLSIVTRSLPQGTVCKNFTWPADQLTPSFPAPAQTQDLVNFNAAPLNTITGEDLHEEKTLFSSLKGIVNRTQPRIFSYEGDSQAEGASTWLDSLGYGYNNVTDIDSLITKYRSEFEGIIVYDPNLIDTLNLATTLAGPRHALVAAPSQVATLTAPPYNLPILADLRGQYSTKLQVYQAMYNDYWPSLQHRVIFELNPTTITSSVREYATAVGGAAVWLDPSVPDEAALLNQFLTSMGPGKIVMGWWPAEKAGVTDASQYGIATVASDYSTNLTFYGGTSRTVTPKPAPPPPALQNKIYVGFVYSDGDNLQYIEHLMRKLWGESARGKVPIGWTVSPAMLDAMPGALNYYWSTATANDELLSGPSGYGYTYPNDWPDANDLDQFIATSNSYASRAGLRIITVWNTITGGIDQTVGAAYAAYAPSLLGLTAQNTGGGTTIYGNALPAHAFDCNYCASAADMRNAIAQAADGWDGDSPRFILIQAQPWMNITPMSFVNVAASLNSKYVVVRPDNFFQLLREANGLNASPGPSLTGQMTSQADDGGYGLIAFTLTNNGAGTVSGANVTSLGFTQTAGSSACTPGVAQTLGAQLNDFAPNTSRWYFALVNFSGCAADARFTANLGYSADSGGSTGSVSVPNITIGDQY